MHAIHWLSGLALLTVALYPQAALGQQVHAGQGQSSQQQASDESQCGSWATEQSGFDPARPPVPVTAVPAPVTGSGARVRGAAVGATVGAIGGNDVGNAAAKGAVVGGVVRRNRNRMAASQQNQANAQQVQAMESAYRMSRKSCLEGRGYTVN